MNEVKEPSGDHPWTEVEKSLGFGCSFCLLLYIPKGSVYYRAFPSPGRSSASISVLSMHDIKRVLSEGARLSVRFCYIEPCP